MARNSRKYKKASELLPIIKELSAQGQTQEQIEDNSLDDKDCFEKLKASYVYLKQ